MVKIFVAGPSGSGKTTVGDDLASRYGWFHFDCEKFHLESDAAVFSRFLKNPMEFIPSEGNVVVTWGFIPRFIDTVRLILDQGFCAVWLTGKTNLLKASVRERGDVGPHVRHPDDMAESLARAATSEELLTPCTKIQAFHPDGTRRHISQLIHHSVSGAEGGRLCQSTLITAAHRVGCVITAAMAHPASDTL